MILEINLFGRRLPSLDDMRDKRGKRKIRTCCVQGMIKCASSIIHNEDAKIKAAKFLGSQKDSSQKKKFHRFSHSS